MKRTQWTILASLATILALVTTPASAGNGSFGANKLGGQFRSLNVAKSPSSFKNFNNASKLSGASVLKPSQLSSPMTQLNKNALGNFKHSQFSNKLGRNTVLNPSNVLTPGKIVKTSPLGPITNPGRVINPGKVFDPGKVLNPGTVIKPFPTGKSPILDPGKFDPGKIIVGPGTFPPGKGPILDPGKVLDPGIVIGPKFPGQGPIIDPFPPIVTDPTPPIGPKPPLDPFPPFDPKPPLDPFPPLDPMPPLDPTPPPPTDPPADPPADPTPPPTCPPQQPCPPQPCDPPYCGGGWPYPLPLPVPVGGGYCGNYGGGYNGGSTIVQPVVQTAAVEPALAAIDLELVEVRQLDRGDMARNLGPAYRVLLRNKSGAAVAQQFNVTLLASIGRVPATDADLATVRISGLEAGQVLAADVRLSPKAYRMGQNADGQPVPFGWLTAVVDSHQEIEQLDRDNDYSQLARAEIVMAAN